MIHQHRSLLPAWIYDIWWTRTRMSRRVSNGQGTHQIFPLQQISQTRSRQKDLLRGPAMTTKFPLLRRIRMKSLRSAVRVQPAHCLPISKRDTKMRR